MKKIIITCICFCSFFMIKSQTYKQGSTTIENVNLEDELSKDDLIKLQLKILIDQHDFLDQIEETKVLEEMDWVRLYSIVFPIHEINGQLTSNGMRLYDEISETFPKDVIMVSIAKTIKSPNGKRLKQIFTDYTNQKINADEAGKSLAEISFVDREVFGVGFKKPLGRLSSKTKIKVLDQFQFIEEGVEVFHEGLNNGQFIFDTDSGDLAIEVSFKKGDRILHKISGKIDNQKDVDSDLTNEILQRLNGNVCYEPYDRTFTMPIGNEFPCVENCMVENGQTFMTGTTKIIPGNDGVLDKFVIITDGIDYANRTTDNILNDLGGVETLCAFLEYGLDIVIVDWPSRRGWIQNNSQYFQGMIQELSEEPHFDRIEMVVGISMGGPVTRHALLEMEDNNIAHNVNNWVAGDSPLQGATVAIGCQAFAREMFQNQEIYNLDIALIGQFNDILNSPGTRQMLLHKLDFPEDYTQIQIQWVPLPPPLPGLPPILVPLIGNTRISPVPDPEYLELQAWFDDRGYPANTVNNIALVDGSSNGTPVQNPGNQILSVDVDLLGFGLVDFKVYASNGLSQRRVMKKKYLIAPTRWTRMNFGIQNMDCAPGSLFPTNRFPSDLIQWPGTWSFIPTTSALGIPGNPNNTDLSTSPFMTNPSAPWENISITAANEYHSENRPDYLLPRLAFLKGRMDPDLFEAVNRICCPSTVNQELQFHFENQWGVEKSEFCMGKNVYMDGSATVNNIEGYHLALYYAENNQYITNTGWLDGSPDLVNLNEVFIDAFPGLQFYPVEYRVRLAISSPTCGFWIEKSKNFKFKECCTPNPLGPPTGPTNLRIEDGNFAWDGVGGATLYRVEAYTHDGPVVFCLCQNPANFEDIYTEETSYPVPDGLLNSCFIWTVRAYCPEIGWSENGGSKCYSPEGETGFVINDGAISKRYDAAENVTLEISPNPAVDKIKLYAKNFNLYEKSVTIVDVSGRIVKKIDSGESKDWIDISILASGVYYVRLENNHANIVKFIKQ